MAEAVPSQATLAPPAVRALKDEAAKDGLARGHMERTISMDIREEREDLKRAAEQSTNAIIELDLEDKVRWISPSWQEVTGLLPGDAVGKPVADLLVDNRDQFAECVEAMRKDDSKSRIVRFAVRGPGAEEALSTEEITPVEPKPGFETRSETGSATGTTQEEQETPTQDVKPQAPEQRARDIPTLSPHMHMFSSSRKAYQATSSSSESPLPESTRNEAPSGARFYCGDGRNTARLGWAEMPELRVRRRRSVARYEDDVSIRH